MSFILDALKKSEAERQRQSDGAYSQVPLRGDDRRQPVWIWVLLVLLLVNLVVVAGLLLRPAAETNTAAAITPQPERPPPAEAAEPRPEAQRFEDRVQSALAERPARQEPVNSPAPEPRTAPSGTVTVAPVGAPTAAATQPQPASIPAAASSGNALPDVDQLRASGDLAVGELRLDIHVFAEQPADRFVFINMVKHREGSTTSDGLVVEEITPQGVILSWRGQEFVLPRQ